MDIVEQRLKSVDVEDYYKRGKDTSIAPMSKAMVRKLYYNWVQKEDLSVSFEEVFLERQKRHVERYERILETTSMTSSRQEIGEVNYFKEKGFHILIFKSKDHRDYKVMNSTKHPKYWIKRVIRDYCEEMCTEISEYGLIQGRTATIYEYRLNDADTTD